ncbi:3-oxo-behenoyl-CoA reductase [Aureococcus anophagefferens]|nr:3-oxo-behenoyl-CoA reductase [Aureococcus anophagefferens]
MPQKRREAFVAAKEAPAALSALEQLVAEAAAAEAGAARTAKREALAAVQAEGRAFRAARSGARRALGRLRADRRGGDDAVGRAPRPSTRRRCSPPRGARGPGPALGPALGAARRRRGRRRPADLGRRPRERGRVKLARLGVDEVRAVILRAHGLGAYAEAFAALKVDGAVLQRAMSVGDVEALGVARRADALRLRDVLATLRADGVAEKAICRAYAARRDAKVVLERTKAVAGAAVVLELFRGGSAEADAGAWDARPYYHNVTSGLSQWTPPLRAWE